MDVTDLKFNTKPAVVDNYDQVVTDSEKEVMMKKNKYAAKRKEQLAKFCSPIKSFLSPCPEFSSFLLPCFAPALMPTLVPTLVPALMPTFMPVPVSYSGFLAILLSHSLLVSVFCLRFPAILSSCCVPALARFIALFLLCHTPVFYCRILAFLSRFLICLVHFFFLDFHFSKYLNGLIR